MYILVNIQFFQYAVTNIIDYLTFIGKSSMNVCVNLSKFNPIYKDQIIQYFKTFCSIHTDNEIYLQTCEATKK